MQSLAKGQSNYPLPKDTSQKDTDGRRDRDADWGVRGSGERKHYWFGYLLHLVVDATYEVPLAFEVTKASTAEQPQAQRLLDQMQYRHPELLQRCGRMSADKGYDDHKLIDRLWQQRQIEPIIAIRNCWRDGEAEEDGVLTKLVSATAMGRLRRRNAPYSASSALLARALDSARRRLAGGRGRAGHPSYLHAPNAHLRRRIIRPWPWSTAYEPPASGDRHHRRRSALQHR